MVLGVQKQIREILAPISSGLLPLQCPFFFSAPAPARKVRTYPKGLSLVGVWEQFWPWADVTGQMRGACHSLDHFHGLGTQHHPNAHPNAQSCFLLSLSGPTASWGPSVEGGGSTCNIDCKVIWFGAYTLSLVSSLWSECLLILWWPLLPNDYFLT